MDTSALFRSLFEAETEEEVTQALKAAGLSDYDENWSPYGGKPNNKGLVHAQQADALSALTEKIVNSIDAVLMDRCLTMGDVPASREAPRTISEAAERYLGLPGGDLSRLSPDERAKRATEVAVAWTGSTREAGVDPSVLVVDRGEGQAPSNFPKTLVSLLEENKTGVRFVQGKYNMGGTGALRFCGREHHYQLIASRRDPALCSEASEWGFTVVRMRPADEEMPYARYEYLAPGGRVLTNGSAPLPLWPDGKTREFKEMQWGTCIKLYEYQMLHRSKATLEPYYALNRRLFTTVVPVRIVEMRPFRGHTNEATLSGMRVRLDENRSAVLEPGFPASMRLEVEDTGVAEVRIAAFRSSEETKHYLRRSEAVYFTLNGQVHSFLPNSFVAAIGLKWLRDSLLIEVDCSRLPARVLDELFTSSRDRMFDCPQARALLDSLSDALKHHPGLHDLNERRRQEAAKNAVESATAAAVLQNLLQNNPELSSLLRSKGPVVDPMSVGENRADFQGRRFPTFLRLSRGGHTPKECPVNGTCRILLETDAENGYLARSDDPGEILLTADGLSVSWTLWNGRLTLTVKPVEQQQVGGRTRLRVRLSTADPSVPAGWLEQDVNLAFTPERAPAPGGNGHTEPRTRGLRFPRVERVSQAMWERFNFDGDSVVTIDQTNGETVAWVNIDNVHLNRACYHHPDRADSLRSQFEIAATIARLWCENLACSEDAYTDEVCDLTLKAFAGVILPLLDLGKLEDNLLRSAVGVAGE